MVHETCPHRYGVEEELPLHMKTRAGAGQQESSSCCFPAPSVLVVVGMWGTNFSYDQLPNSLMASGVSIDVAGVMNEGGIRTAEQLNSLNMKTSKPTRCAGAIAQCATSATLGMWARGSLCSSDEKC